MPRYAQVNLEDGFCTTISYLSGKIEADHMIPLEADQDVQPGDIYTEGKWARPEPKPIPESGSSKEERIAALETDNNNTMIAITESFEIQQAADGQREQETTNTMLALAEAYEIILQQQDAMAALIARVDALEAQIGGEN